MIYILLEAFKGFGKNKSMSFITIGIIVVSIFIFGLFIVGTANLMNIIKLAEDKIEMIAYLEENVTQNDAEVLKNQISSIAGVQDVEFISKEKALEKFQNEFKENSDLLNVFEINPLPASFKIYISMAYKTPEFLEEISNKVSLFDGVDDVDYGAEWVAELDRVVKILFVLDIILGIIITLASIFIVFNTIRLTIDARREQIDVMDLVGATEKYIEVPYIIEGMFHGFIGSVIAAFLLFGIISFVRTRFPDIIFINMHLIYVLVIFGVFLGFIGSFMSVKQCLNEIRERKSKEQGKA